jgi:16S rRNA (guanine(1405)-N(7))-methyltransferase
MTTVTAQTPDELARLVSAAPKYAGICPSLVRRIVSEECAKRSRPADVVKRARSRLYQACGAYLRRRPPYDRWLDELRASVQNTADFRRTCLRMMEFHASTRERIPFMAEFWKTLFSSLPNVNSVTDLACGLSPFAIPWMGLSARCRYLAVDIHTELARFLSGFFAVAGVQGRAAVHDLTQSAPEIEEPCDVVLLLKALPCLEQLHKGSARGLLRRLHARRIAVSYPARSLSGRRTGMRRFYEKEFLGLIDGSFSIINRASFPNETLYIIERKA